MALKDLFGCKHEFKEIGKFKKLKCSKCNEEILIEDK